MNAEGKALACTLELNEIGPRLERLRRLAYNSLTSHQIQGSVLRLAYEGNAAAEVKAVVDLERDCCRFLQFDLQEGAGGVELTITAPGQAGAAAEWLFAQFMPASSSTAPARPCCASCASALRITT